MPSSQVPDSKHSTKPPAVRYLDTVAAYDLWAEVYDTDSNFLQALDSIEMQSLLPSLLARISSPRPWTFVDLGCGTGRNTAALLGVADAKVIGLDASPNMLKVARSRIKSERLLFDVYDLLTDPLPVLNADAVISTLILEHVPSAAFFQAAARLLRVGGELLVTNMHPEMGSISQAGFVDPETGQKIRPKSYIHGIADVIADAKDCGFEIIGQPVERSIDDAMSEKLGPRARKWIGITVWFAIMFRKIHSVCTI